MTFGTLTCSDETVRKQIRFAWLEITPNCQLTCGHCYASSRPGLGHGKLTVDDWKRTMSSLRDLGVEFVQFIGGEPTTHPEFCQLLEYAGHLGLGIEVYSNLLGVTKHMWDLFRAYKVRIATSFYSDKPHIHDAITNLQGSHRKTVTNIMKAIQLGLILRVGIVHVREDQNIPETKSFLTQLGVSPNRIGADRVRGVGRGGNLIKEDPVTALCGHCVSGRCVITAEGTVFPCIMARSFPLGNVLKQDITSIIQGPIFADTTHILALAFEKRSQLCEPLDCSPECDPKVCPPWDECPPDCCPETVATCEPREPEPEPEPEP